MGLKFFGGVRILGIFEVSWDFGVYVKLFRSDFYILGVKRNKLEVVFGLGFLVV